MATFVLVHGAWHGGWCWRKLTPLLRAAGHEVFAPTLTGLGEHAHLLTRDVGLDTHIQDIIKVLEYEELGKVILVGHSYGGMVITGVAERLPERIGHLVYLDAFAPLDEERSVEEIARRTIPDFWRGMEEEAAAHDGWLIPAPTAEPVMDVTDAADQDWLRVHLTDQPAKTFRQRLDGDHTLARLLARTCIRCPRIAGTPTPGAFTDRAERIMQMGGQYYEMAGAGHDAMVTRPRELADVLGTIAARL